MSSDTVRVVLMLDREAADYLDQVCEGTRKAPFVNELILDHKAGVRKEPGIIESMAARLAAVEAKLGPNP